MKNKNTKLSVLALAMVFTSGSCGMFSKSAEEASAKNTVENFVQSPNEFYPTMSELDMAKLPETLEIKKSRSISEQIARVEAIGKMEDGTEHEYAFYVQLGDQPSDNKIIDSDGLYPVEENQMYVFAQKIGAIEATDTTDMAIDRKMATVERLYSPIYGEALGEYQKLKVDGFSWKKVQGGVTGTFRIENGSKYAVNGLKYTVLCYGDTGLVAADTNFVKIGTVDAQSVVKEDFAAFSDQKVKDVTFEILYSPEELAREYVNSREYRGNEYVRHMETLEDEELKSREAQVADTLNVSS